MSNAVETKGEEGLVGSWLRFANSSIGSKMLMAITGLGLWGFIMGHLAGNLTAYAGRDMFNHYAEAIKGNLPLLWATRMALMVGFPLHIITAVRCAEINRAARPVEYAFANKVEANPAAKTMIWSGGVIAVFFVYHLAHFTWRITGPQPDMADPYEMLVMGFNNKLIALLYIAGQVMLAGHLSHGIYSLFHHLGFAGSRWTPFIKKAALAVGYGLCAAFASIPLSVLLGVIK